MREGKIKMQNTKLCITSIIPALLEIFFKIYIYLCLAIWCEELTHGKSLMLGTIEGKRRRAWKRMRWLDSITHSMDRNLSTLQETAEDRGAWHAEVHGVTKSRTWLRNWTAITSICAWKCDQESWHVSIVSRVKQITSPGWMHETSTRTWCTGKT